MAKGLRQTDPKLTDIMRSIDSRDFGAKIDDVHPWEYAILNKSEELIECLIENGRINEVFIHSKHDSIMFTPIDFACSSQEWHGILEFLLINGANPNKMAYRGSVPPLITAALREDEIPLQLLISHKANIDCRHPFYASALDSAITSLRHSNVQLLLKHNTPPSSMLGHLLYDVCQNLRTSFVQKTTTSPANKALEPVLEQDLTLIAERTIKALCIAKTVVSDDLCNLTVLETNQVHTLLNTAMGLFAQLSKTLSAISASPTKDETELRNFGFMKQSAELASEFLILVANSPRMEDSVVEKTMAYSHHPQAHLFPVYATSTIKIEEIFTLSFFEDHPCWSIYGSNALLMQLSREAQALSYANFQRSIELKNGLDEALKSHTPPKKIADIILGYSFPPESLDLAAANYAENHPDALAVMQLLAEDGSGAASAAAHEG